MPHEEMSEDIDMPAGRTVGDTLTLSEAEVLHAATKRGPGSAAWHVGRWGRVTSSSAILIVRAGNSLLPPNYRFATDLCHKDLDSLNVPKQPPTDSKAYSIGQRRKVALSASRHADPDIANVEAAVSNLTDGLLTGGDAGRLQMVRHIPTRAAFSYVV